MNDSIINPCPPLYPGRIIMREQDIYSGAPGERRAGSAKHGRLDWRKIIKRSVAGVGRTDCPYSFLRGGRIMLPMMADQGKKCDVLCELRKL